MSYTEPITAVIFDSFGTLLVTQRPTRPFRQLLKHGATQGRRASIADLHKLMTQPLSLSRAAEVFSIAISQNEMLRLSDLLAEELASITPFSDALEAVIALQQANIRVGVCSNLALPYGAPVMTHFPEMTGYAFSYEHGVMKPDPLLYQTACRQLGVAPGHYFSRRGGWAVMIGDSRRCDRDGPRLAGIAGYHLDRSGSGQFGNLIQFAQLVIRRNSQRA